MAQLLSDLGRTREAVEVLGKLTPVYDEVSNYIISVSYQKIFNSQMSLEYGF
jgi:hypothetical protein